MDRLLGRPLASQEDLRERIGVLAGVAFLGLDALSSAAYGPEAALTVLPAAARTRWLIKTWGRARG